jgi:hypothetical protein
MFGFAIFQQIQMQNYERNSFEKMEAKPYSEKIKVEKRLKLSADSWVEYKLFNCKSSFKDVDSLVQENEEECFVLSSEKNYIYINKMIPENQGLDAFLGNKLCAVAFDKPTIIPCLYERQWNGRYSREPWMSITPSEIFTLRCGTRYAKKHTVVAGLGLGYQLVEVSKRKQVTKITLVEKSQELVDWLLPAIREKMHGNAELEVIVGDAYEIIPKMKADVALIDIYPGYGYNEFKRCPNIEKVWVWGSAKIGAGPYR